MPKILIVEDETDLAVSIRDWLVEDSCLVSLAGTSFALLDNLRIQVMREITNVKLAKKHQLPGQLIKDQLNQLDQLEKSVNAL